jgi:hypothetical protein
MPRAHRAADAHLFTEPITPFPLLLEHPGPHANALPACAATGRVFHRLNYKKYINLINYQNDVFESLYSRCLTKSEAGMQKNLDAHQQMSRR